MNKSLLIKAESHFKKKEYEKALHLYEESGALNKQFIVQYCLIKYMWCLYRVYINIENPFTEERNARTKTSIDYILKNSTNQDRIYQFTVFKVIKELMKRNKTKPEQLNIWLNKLNPYYLSGEIINIDKQRPYQSLKEEWYLLKSEVSLTLEMFNECINVSEEALKSLPNLAQIKKSNLNNRIIKSKQKLEVIYKERESKDIETQAQVKEEMQLKHKEVEHIVFGSGKITSNNEKYVTVLFNDGQEIRFSIDALINENVFIKSNESINVEKMSIDELIKHSNDKFAKGEFDKKALFINRKIIQSGCDDKVKYYARLASCYKNLNYIEEALEAFQEVLRRDNNHKAAKEFMFIYGKGIYHKFNDKFFEGVYRDIGSPPVEEVSEWFDEESRKNALQFEQRIKRELNL